MSHPKVSACIIAYNHENYIKNCLEGALAQEVDFSYEIIISEDCSTDKTREIVKEYQKKYPEKIKLFLNEKNLGLIGNWVKSLERCKGEYVAICEGDDYWTDPNKLQKQVDFLENNPDYALTGHNAKVMKNGTIISDYCDARHKEIMDLSHILACGSGAPTHSLVIRNRTIQNLPDWFSKMHSCDWTIQAIAAAEGKMKFFKEIMGVYRKHDKGANFSAKEEARKKGISDFALPAKYTLEMINALNKHYNYKYDRELRKFSTNWYNFYVIEYMKINNFAMAKKCSRKILKDFFLLSYCPSWLSGKKFLKLIILATFPIFILKSIKK